MIPKLFHRIWLGSDPMSEKWQRLGDTWLEHHPNWKMQLWTDWDFDLACRHGHLPVIRGQVEDVRQRANIFRYCILYSCGGVCLDVDFECLKNIEVLIEACDLFAASENGTDVSVGIIGSIPQHPFFRTLLDGVPDSLSRGERCGCDFFTRMLAENPSVEINVFASHLFYPYTGTDLFAGRTVEQLKSTFAFVGSHAVHHWAGLLPRFGEALAKKKSKLHVGCGLDYREDYWNIDIDPDIKVDSCVNMRELGNFVRQDHKYPINEILAIHCLCYLRPWEAAKFLSDCFDVLEFGGMLAIETVDMEVCAGWILSDDKDKQFEGLRGLCGFGLDHFRDQYPYKPCRFNWSQEALTAALRLAGFVNIRVLDPTMHDKRRDFRIEGFKGRQEE